MVGYRNGLNGLKLKFDHPLPRDDDGIVTTRGTSVVAVLDGGGAAEDSATPVATAAVAFDFDCFIFFFSIAAARSSSRIVQ